MTGGVGGRAKEEEEEREEAEEVNVATAAATAAAAAATAATTAVTTPTTAVTAATTAADDSYLQDAFSSAANGPEIEPAGCDLLNERLITLLSPLATFFIMPAFALANTAIPLGGSSLLVGGGGIGTCSSAARHVPAAGVAAGLPRQAAGNLRLHVARHESGGRLDARGHDQAPPRGGELLGAIGFTMCLLLIENVVPSHLHTLPLRGAPVVGGREPGRGGDVAPQVTWSRDHRGSAVCVTLSPLDFGVILGLPARAI